MEGGEGRGGEGRGGEGRGGEGGRGEERGEEEGYVFGAHALHAFQIWQVETHADSDPLRAGLPS